MILEKSLNVTRFQVTGMEEVHAPIPWLRSGLMRGTFPEIVDEDARYTIGWALFDDPLSSAFSDGEVVVGEYYAWKMRIAEKSVPASTKKEALTVACRNRLRETGKQFLSRREKKEIKEEVENWLIKRTPPTPRYIDVLWNTTNGEIWLFSTSRKDVESFLALFLKTIGVQIEEKNYHYMIKNNPIVGEDQVIIRQGHAKSFGEDFLTWLWCSSEMTQEALLSRNGGLLSIFLGDAVSFISMADETKKQTLTIKGEDIAEKSEGKEWIRHGGLVASMRLDATIDDYSQRFFLTIKAGTFSFHSVRLPETAPIQEADERDGAVLERVFLLEKIFAEMDRLFWLFAALLFGSPEGPAVIQQQIREWCAA